MDQLLSSSILALLLATGWLAAPALAEDEAGADYFDITGSSPTELAAALVRASPYEDAEFLLSGSVAIPMTPAHREEFIADLQASIKASPGTNHHAVLCLVGLLEEEGRFAEAIECIRADLHPSAEALIRESGLLWKSGELPAAAELALRVPDSPANDWAWLSLVRTDLLQGRSDDALRLLGFFHQLSGLAPRVRLHLAIQHLEIARQNGRAGTLIAEAPTPALRAVWNMALGRQEQALKALEDAPARMSPGDISLLATALPGDPLVAEKAREALADAGLPLAERRQLLAGFGKSREVFMLWQGMGGGHAETADLLDFLQRSGSPGEATRDHRICLEFLNANPGSKELKWLAARLDPGGPVRAKPLLLEVAREFRELAGGTAASADPAEIALQLLVGICPGQELQTLVVDAPGFADLPARDRLRYLMAADLDREVVSTIREWDTDAPSANLPGDRILAYFERRARDHRVHDEAYSLLMRLLPGLLVETAPGSGQLLQTQTRSWLEFLGTHSPPTAPLVETIHRLISAAGLHSPEMRNAVIAGIPASLRTLPGLDLEQPAPMSPATFTTLAAHHFALTIFTPPDPAQIGQHLLRHHGDPASRPPHQDPFAISLLATSPWGRNLRGIYDRGRFAVEAQAKLRPLFERAPSRTVIYDLLVATGVVECPDPVVRASAERRIATLDPGKQEDPAIPLYLFFHRLGKGTAIEECLPLLEGLEGFTQSALRRVAVRASAQRVPGHPELAGMIRQKMELKIPPPPGIARETPGNPSTYDRIQFFIEARKMDSPEAIALARDVLFKFTESGLPETTADANLSIVILTSANQFDTFLADLKEMLEAAGRSELEIQRALYRVHQYSIVHKNGEWEPFARRIFELDPEDTEVVHQLLATAIRTADRTLALRCLQAMGRHSRGMLAAGMNQSRKPNLLELFTGPGARELAESLMQIPLPKRPGDRFRSGSDPTFLPLHLHLSRHAPELVMPVMRWADEFTPARGGELLSMALNLRETVSEEEILDLLAEALLKPPPEPSEDAVRFAPRDFLFLPSTESFNLAQYARTGWAKRLSKVADRYPPSDATAGTKLLLRLAAEPTPETWEKVVPEFIETLPIASRDPILRELNSQIASIPGSETLRYFIVKLQDASRDAPLSLISIVERLSLAVKAGDRSEVPELWESAQKQLPNVSQEARLAFVASAANHLAVLADAAVWKAYLEVAGKTDDFSMRWIRRHHPGPELSSHPERVADLARIILDKIEPAPDLAPKVLSLFDIIAAGENPDPGLMKSFVPWIDGDRLPQGSDTAVSARGQWVDMILSDPAAVCPLIHANPGPNRTWTVNWSLAGFRGLITSYPAARPFPVLDGRFDLEFLAGPAIDRLNRIHTVTKAASTGRLNLTLAADAKFISLLARQTEGDIVRWSHPVAIATTPETVPLDLQPTVSGAPGNPIKAKIIPAGGPFRTEDAVQFDSIPGTLIELARMPWTPGVTTMISGWIQRPADAGRISLSFLGEDGSEIHRMAIESNNSEVEPMPHWQRFQSPPESSFPVHTVSVALVFDAASGMPRTIRLSDVRMVEPKVTPPADGFTLLGRIPGRAGPIAFDPRANRFAVYSAPSGAGVFDLSTNRFSGFIPIGDPAQRRGLDIIWMALAADLIVCIDQNGDIHLVSVAGRSATLVPRLTAMNLDRSGPLPVRLSPDGRFLAWSGMMAGLRIARLEDHAIREQRLLGTGRIRWFDFNPAGDTLEAINGNQAFNLDLTEWQTAPLAVRPLGEDDVRAMEQKLQPYQEGQSWTDSVNQVTLRIRQGITEPSPMDPVSRLVWLPEGHVGADREGKPFFITSFGQVFSINITKLKGYLPHEKPR